MPDPAVTVTVSQRRIGGTTGGGVLALTVSRRGLEASLGLRGPAGTLDDPGDLVAVFNSA